VNSSVHKPFGLAALVWAIAGVAICKIAAANSELFFTNLIWMAGLYLLSLCDLFTLGKTVQGILFIISSGSSNSTGNLAGNSDGVGLEKCAGRAIQTFYWAILKLACLGVFVLAMIFVSRGSHSGTAVPTVGILAGVGTVAIVPLLGGLFWSRTVNA
jgi:hypothetical protein